MRDFHLPLFVFSSCSRGSLRNLGGQERGFHLPFIIVAIQLECGQGAPTSALRAKEPFQLPPCWRLAHPDGTTGERRSPACSGSVRPRDSSSLFLPRRGPLRAVTAASAATGFFSQGVRVRPGFS